VIVRLAVLPKEPHPYQESLYEEMRARRVDVHYVGSLTRSQSLNLLLLPAELTAMRVRRVRILHIHWIYQFKLPGTERLPILRRVAQAWFGVVLSVARCLGMSVVWTAHNTLPHARVFHDDAGARRRLIETSDLVIAHSEYALSQLDQRLGVVPRRSVVIPLGPSQPFAAVDAASLRTPGSSSTRRVLFLGRISEYKGVEDLLIAAERVNRDTELYVTVAGRCTDTALGERLRELARALGPRVQLCLEQVSDEEVTELMSACDAVVLPYRRLTTSSSVYDSMVHGRAVVVPDLPPFADIPRDAVLRYDGSLGGLQAVLRQVATCRPDALATLGAAASDHVASYTWRQAAEQTETAMRSLLNRP
jgi:glycosyltransferase involved in cell wall biosynthesis